MARADYGAVLLDERHGKYWRLNETGAVVLETLLAGNDAEHAVTALANRNGAAEDRVRSDVTTFLTSIRETGLVVDQT